MCAREEFHEFVKKYEPGIVVLAQEFTDVNDTVKHMNDTSRRESEMLHEL